MRSKPTFQQEPWPRADWRTADPGFAEDSRPDRTTRRPRYTRRTARRPQDSSTTRRSPRRPGAAARCTASRSPGRCLARTRGPMRTAPSEKSMRPDTDRCGSSVRQTAITTNPSRWGTKCAGARPRAKGDARHRHRVPVPSAQERNRAGQEKPAELPIARAILPTNATGAAGRLAGPDAAPGSRAGLKAGATASQRGPHQHDDTGHVVLRKRRAPKTMKTAENIIAGSAIGGNKFRRPACRSDPTATNQMTGTADQ